MSQTEYVRDNGSTKERSCYPDNWILERTGVPKIELNDSLSVPRIELVDTDILRAPDIISSDKNLISGGDIKWKLLIADTALFSLPVYTKIKLGGSMVEVFTKISSYYFDKEYMFPGHFILLKGKPEFPTVSTTVFKNVFIAAVLTNHQVGLVEKVNELQRLREVYLPLFTKLVMTLDDVAPGGVRCTNKTQDAPSETTETNGKTG